MDSLQQTNNPLPVSSIMAEETSSHLSASMVIGAGQPTLIPTPPASGSVTMIPDPPVSVSTSLIVGTGGQVSAHTFTAVRGVNPQPGDLPMEVEQSLHQEHFPMVTSHQPATPDGEIPQHFTLIPQASRCQTATSAHFHGNFGSFTIVGAATNQMLSPTTDQVAQMAPVRRINDSLLIGQTPDVPSVNSIGVFVKGDGVEETPDVQNENGRRDSQYQNGDASSPLVPISESDLRYQAPADEGTPISEHALQDDHMPYPHECTEDIDDGGGYLEGQHWEKAELIGRGGSGTCFIAIDKATNRMMVVKQVSINKKVKEDIKSEVKIMKHFLHHENTPSHENIIRFFGSTEDSVHVNMFMEYMEGGSLEEARLRRGTFGENTICHYTWQILSGVKYLHRKGIAHRDLKGGNILTDSSGENLRIADFGAAAKIEDHHKFFVVAGTPPYMAPEVVRAYPPQKEIGRNAHFPLDGDKRAGRWYDLKCDVWSIGCVVIEMATGKPPWVLNNPHIDRHAILYMVGKCVETRDPPPIPRFQRADLREFVIRCLRIDPAERPTAAELINTTHF